MFHVHGLWHWLWFMTLYTGWFYDTGTEGALDWGPNISQSDIRVILIGPIRRQKWKKYESVSKWGVLGWRMFLTFMSGRILPLHKSKRLTKTWQHSYIMIVAHDCNKWQMHVKSKKHAALCSSAMQKNIVSKNACDCFIQEEQYKSIHDSKSCFCVLVIDWSCNARVQNGTQNWAITNAKPCWDSRPLCGPLCTYACCLHLSYNWIAPCFCS